MRRIVAPVLVLMLLAAGVAGCFGPASTVTPPQATGAAPELPDTVRFDEGELLEATPTSRTFRWTASMDGPAASARAAGEGIEPAVPRLSAPLVVPGTVPVEVTMVLSSPTGASLRLTLLDEYGFARCAASGSADEEPLTCLDPEMAPLGWERALRVDVAAANTRESRIPFEVELTVRTLPGEVREPVEPAGLAEVAPFETTAHDGAALRGHVYLPNGDGPFATVLHFSPYWNGGSSDQSEAQAIEVAGRRTIAWSSAGHLGVLLDAGFAVALVNLRGTGESGGCPTLFDVDRDGDDAHAVVETLAAEPWSNGRVGMMGISWHGYSQYAAASARPPSLKALAPASAILDPWLLWTRHGAPLDLHVFTTGLAYYGVVTGDNGGWFSLSGDRSADRVACPEHAEGALEWEKISETGDETPFWRARRTHEAIANSGIPMLVTNGLRVPAEGHVLQVEGLWPLLPAGSHLMIGQWGHAYPEQSGVDRYPRMLVDWFDEHLRGGPQRVAPGVTYQDLDGQWHEAREWPPRSARTELFLTRETLTFGAEAVEASEQTFQSLDDEDPRPSVCPFWAVYATPPLEENVTLAGHFELDVTISSTEADGNFAAVLWHAEEVMACEEDLMEDASERIVARALTDLRHRGYLRQGTPFPPGAPDLMRLQSHPFAAEVPAGHRLVLAIGGDSASELRDKPLLPALTVHTGDGSVGSLRLPVVEGALRFR